MALSEKIGDTIIKQEPLEISDPDMTEEISKIGSVVIKDEIVIDEQTNVEYNDVHNSNETEKCNFQCAICRETFNNARIYKRHYAGHMRRKYSCSYCNEIFNQKHELTVHMLTHASGGKNQCEICYKTFTHSKNYTLHMRTHEGERPFECETCHRSFIRRAHYERHIKIHTANIPLYTCRICQKTYTQEISLEQHMSKHGADKEYSCEICLTKFMRLIDYVSHMKMHTDENSFRKEWSKADTCRLISYFHQKPELWDSTYAGFKNRRLKHEAWNDIAKMMNHDRNDVERKMRSVIGQFQREQRRRSVSDDEHPKWFAYNLLLFLGDKNRSNPFHSSSSICEVEIQDNNSSEEYVQNRGNNEQDVDIETPQCTVILESPRPENIRSPQLSAQLQKSITRKINDTSMEDPSCTIMKNLYNKLKRDEYDIFGESVACSIKKLKTAYAKSTVKYHINNILYQAELGHYDQPPHFGQNSNQTSVNVASESTLTGETSTDDLDMIQDL